MVIASISIRIKSQASSNRIIFIISRLKRTMNLSLVSPKSVTNCSLLHKQLNRPHVTHVKRHPKE